MEGSSIIFTVVVTGESLAPEAMKILSGKCRVQFAGPYPKPPELAQKLKQEKADALIVRTGKIPAEVIKASPELKVISKHGIGVDTVDVQTATELKIPVLVASSRQLSIGGRTCLRLDVVSGQRYRPARQSDSPGVLGQTPIPGSGTLPEDFGDRRVWPDRVSGAGIGGSSADGGLIFDPLVREKDIPRGVRKVSALEQLLKKADIVSLHCPLTDKTRHLIGQKELGRMKKTAWLINTARGEVVDEKDLIAALREGRIGAAGIDTFQKEPPEDLQDLCNSGKVVLTPHVGASTEEAFIRMGIEAAKNVLNFLEGKKPDGDSLVNPEVLTKKRKAHNGN